MRHLVYLLCLPSAPDGSPRHYVGISTPSRWRKRMMEHRSGKGGKATQELAESGVGWFLTNYWLTDDPALEQRLQQAPDLAQRCPRCRHGLTGAPQIPYTKEKGGLPAALTLGFQRP